MSLIPRGQSSLELLLVAAAVISITVGVLAIATKENSTTTALSIVKAQAISKLNEVPGNYLITRIDYKESGSAICFNIITNKAVTETISFDMNAIASSAGYASAKIEFNSPGFACP